MLESCSEQENGIRYVLVYDLSRFSRGEWYEVGHYIHLLKVGVLLDGWMRVATAKRDKVKTVALSATLGQVTPGTHSHRERSFLWTTF